jgi:hypothetical protein
MFEVNWNIVGVVFALVFYGVLAVLMMRKHLCAALAHLKAMPRPVQVVTAILVVVATVQAQKPGNGGGTNEPPSNAPGMGGTNGIQHIGGHSGIMLNPTHPHWANAGLSFWGGGLDVPTPTVAIDDIVRGYRLVYETNDVDHAYTMPANGVYVGNSHIHGASSSWGMNLIDFGDWSFPFGSNHTAYSKFWWFVDGRIRVSPLDPAGEISTGASEVLAMQGASRIWRAADVGGQVIGWESVFVGGDTNSAANLQIVLKDNGDFETWSNEVGRVYARINPDDWDGDGLDNVIDVWPAASDGYCFGTGVDWLNANCCGVLSASAGTNGEIVIEWGTNANANAYYWLQFTVQADGTRATVDCDGPSNLGDMVVIANSNQVCRVPLLMGAEYRVRASLPVSDISASDPEANIWINDAPPSGMRGVQSMGPSRDFGVERPVSFSLEGAGGSGYLAAQPDIGAVIGVVTGNCCQVSIDADAYTWTCCSSCHCDGYGQWWDVTALWEGYSKLFSWWAQCGCQAANESNPEVWFSLSCPSVIMKNGNSHTVYGSFNPPCETNATMTLSCVQGLSRISVLGSGDAWMEVQGVAASDEEGDVLFELRLDMGGASYVITQAMTVAEVKYLHMESELRDTEKNNNQPPFVGETPCPFCVTNSPLVDKHIAIPYYRVVNTNDFSVSDFSVNMRLELNPDVCPPYNAEWQILSNTAESGALANMHGLCADFANPKHGGVIRLRSRVDGSPWTEGNIVLPLAGASIDDILEGDLAAYAAQMDWLIANYNQDERNSKAFGERWFVSGGNGDYIGRPDSAARPTVWLYNQVNDAPTSDIQGVGFGAVMTWHGLPTRLSKVSNLFVSFGTKRIGVSEWRRQLSRIYYGTSDFFFGDGTSSMSWEAGNTLSMTNFAQTTGMLVTNMWLRQGAKERRLWPNTANADNHVQWSRAFDYNRQFVSPTTVELGMQILYPNQGE